MKKQSGDLYVHPSMRLPLETVLTGVKASTRLRYLHSAAVYDAWLADRRRTVVTVRRTDMINYRAYLERRFSAGAASASFSLARKLLATCVQIGSRSGNPAEGICTFLITEQAERRALAKEQVTGLLALADTSDLKGKRDYVLLSFLVCLGLSYGDCVALSVSNLILVDGHVVALQLGEAKGYYTFKLYASLARALDAYVGEAGTDVAEGDAPLLGSIAPWGHHLTIPGQRITINSVERLLRSYAQHLGLQIDNAVLLATVAVAAGTSRSRIERAQNILGRAIIDVRRRG